jgi:hypothetical protein
MIKASHRKFWVLFFNVYSALLFRIYFRKVHFIGQFEDRLLPVLILSNHFSWFDGFIQLRLNRRFFKRRYYVMMLEEQLRRHPFLRKGGCFSIRKGSRSILESLHYAIHILKDPRNALLLYPQGKIQSLYTESLQFEKGLEYILKKIDCKAEIIFNVNLVDYFSFRKPVLNCYFASYEIPDPADAKIIEADFNTYMKHCKSKQKEE